MTSESQAVSDRLLKRRIGELKHARSFRDLVVYQKAFKVAKTIYEISKCFPKEERYSLTDQIRRASRSVGAQIAEAWGKRRYERHFISKLTDADSEQLETQHWIDVAVSCEYMSTKEANEITSDLEATGRMLNTMILKANLFCGTKPFEIREEQAEYIVTNH